MPVEGLPAAAEELVAQMMVTVGASAARRQALAEGREGPALELGSDLHPDHLEAACVQAWHHLRPLGEERRLQLVEAVLDASIGAPATHARTLRQMLGNDGVRPPLQRLEPPIDRAEAHAAFTQMRRLNAELVHRAHRAFAAWQARGDDAPGAAATDALLVAERACLVALGAHHPRTVRAIVACLQRSVDARNGPEALQRLEMLALAQAELDTSQLGVVVGLVPLMRQELVAQLDADARFLQAEHWAARLAWAHGEARRTGCARSLIGALARGVVAARQKGVGELLLEDDDDEALEMQIEQVLDRLAGEGPAAAELGRRAVAKLSAWRRSEGDARGACGVWLHRWLAVASGYPFGALPQPMPPYDRGERSRPRRLSAAEVTRRLGAFADAFPQQIVGNAALFGKLHDYLADVLTHGRPAVVTLHGAPGTGKGEVAKLVAQHLFADHLFFSRNLGGARGAERVLGVAPNYHGAELSLFGEGLAARRGGDVFFFVDEIDHTCASAQDALATALEVDERTPFRDGCLDVPLSLRHDVMFFACNDLCSLQPHLRSRLERGLVLHTEELSESARFRLYRRRLLRELQVGGANATRDATSSIVSDAALRDLEHHHGGPKRGVREMMGALARLAAASRHADYELWQPPLRSFHTALVDRRDHLAPYNDYGLELLKASVYCEDVAEQNWQREILAPLRCTHGEDATVRVQFERQRMTWQPLGDHRLELVWGQVQQPETRLVNGLRQSPGGALMATLSLASPPGYALDVYVDDPYVRLLPQQRRLELLLEVKCRGAAQDVASTTKTSKNERGELSTKLSTNFARTACGI